MAERSEEESRQADHVEGLTAVFSDGEKAFPEFYEEEVNNAVDALSSLIEPFVMLIIGVLVGGMVVGMYLPIFKLAATM